MRLNSTSGDDEIICELEHGPNKVILNHPISLKKNHMSFLIMTGWQSPHEDRRRFVREEV